MSEPKWLEEDKALGYGVPYGYVPLQKQRAKALERAHAHIDELRKMLDWSDASEEAEALLFRREPPCVHAWEVIDSMLGEMSVHGSVDVVCKQCQMSGERDGKTGKVYWPAT